MQLVGTVLLACLAGLASAEKKKQIIVGASPPPPASTATVPGIGFSVVAPGYTTSTWTQTLSDKLCSTFVNAVTGYDKNYVKCTVASVATQGTAGVTAVQLGGYLYWAAFPGSNVNNAIVSRNNLAALFAEPDTLLLEAVVPGAKWNFACDPTWVPASGGKVSGWLPVLGFPNAQCKVAKYDYDADVFSTGATGQFSDYPRDTNGNLLTTLVGSVGIDNGKVCASDNIIATTGSDDPNRSVDLGVLGSNTANPENFNYIVCNFDLGTCELQVYNSGAADLSDLVPFQTMQLAVTTGTGIPAVQFADFVTDFPNNPLSSNCQQQLRNFLFNNDNEFNVINYDDIAAPALVQFAENVAFGAPSSSLSACPDTGIYATFTGGNLFMVGGDWAPECDTDETFYQTNSAPRQNNNLSPIGYACPTCFASQNSNTKVRFQYTGPNAGKFCTLANEYTAPDGINGIDQRAVHAHDSVLSDASCISIGVSAETTAGNAGKPMIPEGENVLPNGKALPVSAFFPPTTRTSNAGIFGQNSVRLFNTLATYGEVALDTQWSIPCSTPAITQPTSNSVTALLAKVGTGSCNTKSVYQTTISAATPPVGTVRSPYAWLPTDVIAPVVVFSPPPSPPSPPSNGTSPSPAPAPSPPPAPSPAPAVTCTYSGRYQIQSVACAGRYLAFSMSATDNLVYLRTISQSSPPRTHFNLNATAVIGGELPAGKAILAEKTGAPNQLAHPDSGPKLGGTSWKYKIIPDTTTTDCNIVRLAGNSRPAASKYLGVNDSCTGYTWSALSSNPAQTFKLNKI